MKILSPILRYGFYTILILIILVAIIVHGAALWLVSDSGGRWVKAQIESATTDSGYQIDLGELKLSFMGVKVTTLSVKGDDGLDMNADNIRLSLNPFPLAMKNLSAALRVGSLSINHLPEGEGKPQPEIDRQPIVIPDLFFRSIDAEVDFERITLPDNDTGYAFATDQSIQRDGDGNLSIDGDLTIGMEGQDLLPETIENNIMFDGSIVTVDELRATHESYDVNITGTYDVINETLSAVMKGETDLPAKMASADIGTMTLSSNLEGPIDAMSGAIELQSSYKGQPLSLQSDMDIDGEKLALNNLRGLSENLDLSGAITLPFDTAIADGDIALKTDQPSQLLALAGIEETLKGSLIADIRLYNSDSAQGIDADVTAADIDYQGVTVKAMNAKATIENVAEASVPDIDMTLTGLRYDTTEIQTASGVFSLRDEGGYALTLDAKGRNIQPFTITADVIIPQTEPLAVTVNDARLDLQQGTVTLKGTMSEGALDATLTASDILPQYVPFATLPEMSARLDHLEIRATQTPSNPKLNGDFELVTLSDTSPNITVNGTLAYADKMISATAQGTGNDIKRLDADISMPMDLSLYPFNVDYSQSAALKGQVAALFDLGILKAFIADDDFVISGSLQADAQISGSIGSPQINGDAKISNANVREPISGLILRKMNGAMTFSRDNLVISSLSATGEDGDGTLNVSGSINVSDMANPDIDLTLDAQNIHVLSGPPYDVKLNADVDIISAGEYYDVTGGLSLGEVMIDLPENQPQSIPQLNIVEPEAENKPSFMERVRLDLEFVADNKIFVRGYGVDTEMAGKLDVTGSAANPLVNGELSSIRGRYEDFGRQFRLEQAVLRFQGTIPPSPYLDIIAATNVDDVVAKVNIGGTPTKPSIGFSSVPPMPEDEVLSHILFGEDIRTISPFQAIQLANTLRRLSGNNSGPSLNILGGIRDATGLDDIRIEGSGENAKVGAGKYITDRVYLDVTKGAGEDSGSARVEVEITPSISAESKVTQSGESDSNIFWRWDY